MRIASLYSSKMDEPPTMRDLSNFRAALYELHKYAGGKKGNRIPDLMRCMRHIESAVYYQHGVACGRILMLCV